MNTYPFEVVVITHSDRGTPHLDRLQALNEGLTVHVYVAGEGDDAWKNNDRNVRQWLLDNPDHADRILFIEYDVLVNIDLLDALKDSRANVEVTRFFQSVIPNGPPLFTGEALRLPTEYRTAASGISPGGVLMLDRTAMDVIASDEHADFFASDVFCELRIGTVVRHSGLTCLEHPIFFDCHCHAPLIKDLNSPVVHPVKHAV